MVLKVPMIFIWGLAIFSYELPDGTEKDVYIDESNSSLNGIARLITNNTDGEMVAHVINDGSGSDTPWKLIVSYQKTGDESRVNFPNFYLIDGEEDFALESERPAQDAKVKLDGFEVEVPDNKVTTLIPGVTINLKKAVPEEEFTITITEDAKKITDKVSLMVDKVNAVLKFINDQNSIDAKTDTSRTLASDITLTTFESRLRTLIFTPYQTREGPRRLSDLGISFQKDGQLAFNKEKFEAATNSSFLTVSELLNGMFSENGEKTIGFINDLSQMLELSLRTPDGVITNRRKGLQSRIDQIDRRIEQRQKIIDQKEKNLKDKFAKLEGTISRIKSQGAGLQAISGGGAGGIKIG